MANRNTAGFGLVPAGTLGGSPSIQGQGKYKIDAGHSTTIYNGECVKISSGYVVGGNGSAAPFIGVLNGIFFNACLLYTSPSPRDGLLSRMPSSA